MKRFLWILLVLSTTLSLAACTSAKKYADDLSADKLNKSAISSLADSVEYTTAADGFLDDYFTVPSYAKSVDIRFATDANNLNEFGVFQVEAGNAKAMETLLKDYLSKSYQTNQAWYDSYIPAETPKLRDAEVKVFGNYAVYAIADTTTRTSFFEAIESQLTK